MTRYASNTRRGDTGPNCITQALCQSGLGNAVGAAGSNRYLFGNMLEDGGGLGAPCA